MRTHLWWIALGSVLAMVTMMAVGSALSNRAEEQRDQQNQKWSGELVDEKMEFFGYKRVDRRGEENVMTTILRGRRYAYCPTEKACDTLAGNVDHPPVNISFGAARRVHVWWQSPSAVQDGTTSSRLLTICVAGPAAIGTMSIANAQWAANVAAAAEDARRRVVQEMIAHSAGHPVSTTEDGQVLDAKYQIEDELSWIPLARRLMPVPFITFRGWRCPVPPGPPPR